MEIICLQRRHDSIKIPGTASGYQQVNSLSRREKDALWFVMLATQALFVDWFFQHHKDELARKNLEAFSWIFRQRDEITRRISYEPV